MFDDEVTDPQVDDEAVTVAWEKVTGLSRSTLGKIEQDLELKLTNRLISSLPLDTMEAIKPPLGVMETLKPSLDMIAAIKPSLGMMEAIKPQLSVMETLKPTWSMLDSIAKPWEGMRDQLASLSTSLIGISQSFDWIGSTASVIGNVQAWMPINFKHIEEKLRLSILAAFERVGLCLAPSMSEDLMHRVAWYTDRGDLRSVTLLVWNYYANNDYARLRQAVSRWRTNPEFAARWNFIDAALRTHTQKIYEASISTLMFQVEGIAGTFVYNSVMKKGIKINGLSLKKSKELVLHMLEVAGDVANLDVSIVGFMGWIMVKSIVQYIQNVLYRWADFEQDFENIRKSRVLHRHG
jgi:hypothetical protein